MVYHEKDSVRVPFVSRVAKYINGVWNLFFLIIFEAQLWSFKHTINNHHYKPYNTYRKRDILRAINSEYIESVLGKTTKII